MSGDAKNLFAERLGRYQAAIDLEPTDRIPIATGSNYFAEVYSGNTDQETIYNSEKWLQADTTWGCWVHPGNTGFVLACQSGASILTGRGDQKRALALSCIYRPRPANA